MASRRRHLRVGPADIARVSRNTAQGRVSNGKDERPDQAGNPAEDGLHGRASKGAKVEGNRCPHNMHVARVPRTTGAPGNAEATPNRRYLEETSAAASQLPSFHTWGRHRHLPQIRIP